MSNVNLTPKDEEPTTSNDPSTSGSKNLYFNDLSPASKKVLKQLLDSWEMGSLYKPCIDGHISIQDLHEINNIVTAILYNRYSIHLQIDYQRRIEEFEQKEAANKRKKNPNEPSSSSPSSSNA